MGQTSNNVATVHITSWLLSLWLGFNQTQTRGIKRCSHYSALSPSLTMYAPAHREIQVPVRVPPSAQPTVAQQTEIVQVDSVYVAPLAQLHALPRSPKIPAILQILLIQLQ